MLYVGNMVESNTHYFRKVFCFLIIIMISYIILLIIKYIDNMKVFYLYK